MIKLECGFLFILAEKSKRTLTEGALESSNSKKCLLSRLVYIEKMAYVIIVQV